MRPGSGLGPRPLGVIGGFWIGQRFARGADRPAAGAGARFFAFVVILVAFIAATYSVMAPVSGVQQACVHSAACRRHLRRHRAVDGDPLRRAGGRGRGTDARWIFLSSRTFSAVDGVRRERFADPCGLLVPEDLRWNSRISIIHQPVRLKIVAALKGLPPGAQLEFVRLKALVGATEGNLGAHLTTLEEAGYAAIEKDFAGKRPRTRVALTRQGRARLRRLRRLSERHHRHGARRHPCITCRRT